MQEHKSTLHALPLYASERKQRQRRLTDYWYGWAEKRLQHGAQQTIATTECVGAFAELSILWRPGDTT